MIQRMERLFKNQIFPAATIALACSISVSTAFAQKKKPARAPKSISNQKTSELEKLRKQYIDTTKQYKASLEKLLPLYQNSLRKAEERRTKSKELFSQGLISKTELEQSEEAVTLAQAKVAEVQQQTINANTQIAQTLVEIEGEKQLARLGPVPRGGFVRTTSFIRYNGAAPWVLAQAGKIEVWFQSKFGRPLPIAVFGQGVIHNQWRLDHHNAMDISLNPDGVEGQTLIDYLRANGIPFSAFRTAIPGVATGPHIHVGLPSHRY